MKNSKFFIEEKSEDITAVTPKMVIIALGSFIAKIFAMLWIFAMIRPGEKWSTFCANHIVVAVAGFLLVGYFLFSEKNGWFKKK